MNIQLVRQLTYAGLVPFLVCTLFLGWGIDTPLNLEYFEIMLMSYALAIISFLCGIHWGVALLCPEKAPVNLFVLSNVLVLAVWLCFLLDCAGVFYVLSIIVLAVLLWVDKRLFRRSVFSRLYYQLRKQVTAVVVVCLLITVLF